MLHKQNFLVIILMLSILVLGVFKFAYSDPIGRKQTGEDSSLIPGEQDGSFSKGGVSRDKILLEVFTANW